MIEAVLMGVGREIDMSGGCNNCKALLLKLRYLGMLRWISMLSMLSMLSGRGMKIGENRERGERCAPGCKGGERERRREGEGIVCMMCLV